MADLNKVEIGVDEVIAAYGDHYINEGQNMNNLHMLPFEPFGTQEAGTVIETDQTVLREANIEVSEVLQQYQDDFTSKGGVDFKPVMIPLYNVKIDAGFIPHKLIKSWLGFLTNNSILPETYPFIKWVVENYLLMQKDEDLELQAIYNGIYEAPVGGTAGAANKVMDGIGKLIADLLTASEITPITTGALGAMTAVNFVTAIETFVKSFPEKYRYNVPMAINMNRTLRDKFREGNRLKYNVYYTQDSSLDNVMGYDNITVAGRASMQGKGRIWATPKYNLLLPVKGFSNSKGFDVQKVDRKVKFLTDWWMGAGFVQPQLIFVNEQV